MCLEVLSDDFDFFSKKRSKGRLYLEYQMRLLNQREEEFASVLASVKKDNKMRSRPHEPRKITRPKVQYLIFHVIKNEGIA